MQTFVPHTSFAECARVLDRQRLGKQRVEVLQLLRALTGETKGWANHPAALMWRGHEFALAAYGLVVCAEWTWRGYRDTTAEKIRTIQARLPMCGLPHWWNGPIHASHRGALLAKAPEHYAQFGWSEQPGIDYVWPATAEKGRAA